MLAHVIYALDGEGFPAAAADESIKQDSLQQAWKACAVAARSAWPDHGSAKDPVALHVVFWMADSTNPGKLVDQAGLKLSWPYQPESHVVRVSGAILDGVDPRPKRLFFFDKIAEDTAVEMDGNASPGLWPRSDATTSAATSSLQPAQTPRKVAIATPRPLLATVLFALWVASGIGLAIWLWLAGNMLASAAPGPDSGVAQNCLKGGTAWTSDCEQTWLATLSARLEAPAGTATLADKIYDRAGLWVLAGCGGSANLMLRMPFVLAMGSIVLLLLASGLATKGVWFGVLIDDRNRISLSRTQQVAWTILLLAAVSIMGWFNAAAMDANATVADILPTIPGALWAALGVNLIASPYLSDLILDKQGSAEPSGPGHLATAAAAGAAERQVDGASRATRPER